MTNLKSLGLHYTIYKCYNFQLLHYASLLLQCSVRKDDWIITLSFAYCTFGFLHPNTQVAVQEVCEVLTKFKQKFFFVKL